MMRLQLAAEHWQMREPFTIARETITHQPALTLWLHDAQGRSGWAEAAGIDYDGETPEMMAAQLRAIEHRLHDDLTHSEVATLLGAGGARNALDCALWDLRARQTGVPAWQAAGLAPPQPLVTAYTIGLGNEETTRRKAAQAVGYPLLKLKVDARCHLDMVRWVRLEHPAARLVVDANQGWNCSLLRQLLPALADAGVELVEQPLPYGADAELDGWVPALPLAADESCTDRSSLAALTGRYQLINIKLDKCGGLTEALALADEAERLGLRLMVGNMCGSSLAMAPAFLLAQRCEVVDLDGPLLQCRDRDPPMRYDGAVLHPPLQGLWGG